MSQSTSLRRPVRASSIIAAVQTLFWGWSDTAIRWRQRRRQWQNLRELDDRMLADVGISPEDAFRKAGRPLQSQTPAALERDHRS